MRQLGNGVAHHRDVGRVHGNVAAHAAHRDAHKSALERGRIVHAVAHHGQRRAPGLAGLNVGELILRHALGHDLVDACRLGNRMSGSRMVAREQHALHALVRQRHHSLPHSHANRVRERSQGKRLAIGRNENHRVTEVPRLFQTAGRPCALTQAHLGHHGKVAGNKVAPSHARPHTSAGNHLEAFGLLKRATLLPRRLHHCLAQRVLAQKLARGEHAEQLPRRKAATRRPLDRYKPRTALGKRARLVERDLLHAGKALQSVALLYEEAVLGRVPDGRHHRCGRSEHERTRAEHDEHGDGPQRLPRQGKDRGGCNERAHHNPGGPAVGQAHNLRLARLSAAHKTRHPLHRAIGTRAGCPHLDGSELVDRAREDLVTHLLVTRHGLAGKHCLVDARGARHDAAVHGNRLAGKNAHQISLGDVFHLAGLFGPVASHHAGLRGRHLDEPLDARPGSRDRQLLKQAAQLHDEGDLAGGEVLPHHNRGDEGQRHEQVGLDVVFVHHSQRRLAHDGHAA